MSRLRGFAISLGCACAMAAFSGEASATTLGFSAYSGFVPNHLTFPEATFTGENGLFVKAYGGGEKQLCSYDITVKSCAADLTVDFSAPVSNLTFDVFGFQRRDAITVSVFDALMSLVGTYSITGNGIQDLSSFTNVARLLFDDNSGAYGVAYGPFSFEAGEPTPMSVPLPAALPLLATALAALGLAGWAHSRKMV